MTTSSLFVYVLYDGFSLFYLQSRLHVKLYLLMVLSEDPRELNHVAPILSLIPMVQLSLNVVDSSRLQLFLSCLQSALYPIGLGPLDAWMHFGLSYSIRLCYLLFSI